MSDLVGNPEDWFSHVKVHLFHVPGIAPESRAEVSALWRITLRPATGLSSAAILIQFFLNVIWSRCFVSCFCC